MTVRTRAELNADADSYLPDNTTGAVTVADVRQRIKDLADSAILQQDIETGTWTPSLTFATPGDLVVGASSIRGAYQRQGRRVDVQFTIIVPTFTYTTHLENFGLAVCPSPMHLLMGPGVGE